MSMLNRPLENLFQGREGALKRETIFHSADGMVRGVVRWILKIVEKCQFYFKGLLSEFVVQSRPICALCT